MKAQITAAMLGSMLVWGGQALAVEPVGGDEFNLAADIDFHALTAENFYETLVPLAQAEGTVVLFDFSNSFEPLFRDHLIPAFQSEYGVTVDYQRGDRDAAIQQLIATNNVGQPAPFDVLFIHAGAVFVLSDADAMANLPLHELMPNGTRFDPDIATTTNGFNHGGRYVPFHRNQTAIIYDIRHFEDGGVPTSAAAILDWAKANPGHFALTNPAGGGSGDGFLQSIMIELVQGDACRETLLDYGIDEAGATAFVASDCAQPVWDFFAELLPVAELTGGNSDTLNLVANGVAWTGTAWEDMTYDFVNRGLLPPATRLTLLEAGQVGGGDGLFMAPRAVHPAASLLLLDFLSSVEMQTLKLGINGSRTANLDVVTEGQIPEDKAQFLVPDDEFFARATASLPRPIINAGIAYFQDNLLRR